MTPRQGIGLFTFDFLISSSCTLSSYPISSFGPASDILLLYSTSNDTDLGITSIYIVLLGREAKGNKQTETWSIDTGKLFSIQARNHKSRPEPGWPWHILRATLWTVGLPCSNGTVHKHHVGFVRTSNLVSCPWLRPSSWMLFLAAQGINQLRHHYRSYIWLTTQGRGQTEHHWDLLNPQFIFLKVSLPLRLDLLELRRIHTPRYGTWR